MNARQSRFAAPCVITRGKQTFVNAKTRHVRHKHRFYMQRLDDQWTRLAFVWLRRLDFDACSEPAAPQNTRTRVTRARYMYSSGAAELM